MNYQKKILLLIAVSTVVRLFFASLTELGADEVYYWTYALKLQWNYFDHPPIVAWLIRLTTGNLIFHNEIFIRLGAVITAAICTWLIYKLGTFIHNVQTGWYAALLYTTSLYCSFTVGANIVPDSPELVFWLASILLLIKISRLADDSPGLDKLWCLFGLTAGLCIMSKVHGVFLWFGVLLYVLIVNRNLLKHRGIYLSAVITLIIVSPIIIWNIQNNFITYKFHSSRVSMIGSGFYLWGFIKEVFGEIATNNPVNVFLLISAVILAIKGKLPVDKKEIMILLFCSLPLIITVLIIALSRETFPYWSGPAYSTLLILPAVKLATGSKSSLQNIPKVIKVATIYMLIIAVLDILVINYFPGTISAQKYGLKTGNLDLSLDSYGWKEAGEKFDSLYKSDVVKKTMPFNAPIIATNWDTGAAIEFNVSRKTRQEVIGMGDIFDLHQYYWTNKYKTPLKDGDSAYLIVPSNTFFYRTFNEVSRHFSYFEEPLVITQYRSGVLCRYVYVFRMRGYKK
ncbi:MAG: phospholipid carrier-dependent glycosyltransferase [Mucilaginibacter sp.]|nr:phospholipid carrier-dependent glycosyltransferase [Mucilaginibacter sp.]